MMSSTFFIRERKSFREVVADYHLSLRYEYPPSGTRLACLGIAAIVHGRSNANSGGRMCSQMSAAAAASCSVAVSLG